MLQLRVHRQREKELSALSSSPEVATEVAKHLQRWQNLLAAHSLELAELINNLDEEAAADIRKVRATERKRIIAYLTGQRQMMINRGALKKILIWI